MYVLSEYIQRRSKSHDTSHPSCSLFISLLFSPPAAALRPVHPPLDGRDAQSQLVQDVAAHARGGRGCQRHHRRVGEHAAQLAQPLVVRPAEHDERYRRRQKYGLGVVRQCWVVSHRRHEVDGMSGDIGQQQVKSSSGG